MSQQDDAFAELVVLTGLGQQEWQDILSLPPAGQRLALQTYADASWIRSPDTLGKVLDVLGVLSTIVGFAGGAAGAISAIRAL